MGISYGQANLDKASKLDGDAHRFGENRIPVGRCVFCPNGHFTRQWFRSINFEYEIVTEANTGLAQIAGKIRSRKRPN
ncbi:hypothetical protein OAF43_01625, partial [bacterium]|nr:hypothetical protein [bacterium]